MFKAGIHAPKGRSMVAVLHSKTQTAYKPFAIAYTAEGLITLVERLGAWDNETLIVAGHTGRHHESVALFLHGAGFFVSALKLRVFTDYQDGILGRRIKTDEVVFLVQVPTQQWQSR